ncbi:MAG: SAM-dependent methyltransferase [Alphaproteobacteria bacterium]
MPSPSPWVARFAALISGGGPVLDLACGNGRHTRLLRQRGHPVIAVDRDVSGVADLDGVEAIEADLEDGAPWPLAGRQFAGVVVTNYLHRPLFPAIVAAVEPDGVLIYETFMAGNGRFGKPSNPDFLLRENELFDAVGELTAIAFEQGLDERVSGTGGPAMRQRICAIRGAPVLA